MGQCQLYKYNKSFYSIKKETSHYFSQDFIENEMDDDHIAWLNFHGLENKEEIELLCKKLEIDRLSVDTIYNPSRRPKVEEYSNYVFFSIKSALPTDQYDLQLEQEQISFILGKNYLISFQDKSSDHFPDVRNRIETARGKIRLIKFRLSTFQNA
jgi:magnesium transporter